MQQLYSRYFFNFSVLHLESELPVSEMHKNRVGITQFVSEIKRVENYLDFEKLAQALQHGAQGFINISYCVIVRARVVLKRTVVGD